MLRRPVGARDLPVRDVTDEHVQERILGLVRHRRPAGALHELLSLERMQKLLDVLARAAVDQAAEPEDLAEHGRVLEQLLLGRGKAVDPRRDDAVDRLGDAHAACVGLVGHHPSELLRVQGIAAGMRQ